LDTEPIAVALKFGFLAVLYLFLLWVSRSALRELRKTGAPAPEATGFHPIGGGGRAPATDAFLVVVTGGGLQVGERFDLFGGLSIGRSGEADIGIDDRFASSVHCRLYSRGASYFVEDLNSTNGTFLNGSQLHGEAELHDLDEVKIGDTEFRFELDVPNADGGG
jgi:FHA domain